MVILMNLKKMILVNSLITFLLCFLTHFIYDLLPNPLFAIFFPVNESIWEHMKMLYTTILLYGLGEYFVLKKKKINHHNFTLTLFLKAFLSIPIYLALYLPIFYNFGENMFINFTILIITIFIVNLIGYFLLNLRPFKYQKIIGVILIIFLYVIMIYLTYKPLKNDLFFDPKEEKYGLNDYLINKK